MKNESKYRMNNSSMFTAENSSFQSKKDTRKSRQKSEEENKYSNTVIFQLQRRGQSNKNDSIRNKRSLYLTDIMNTTYNRKEINLKNTFDLTSVDEINKKMRKKQLSKEVLPSIVSYNKHKKYIKNPECFTCCNTKLTPQYLTRLYNDQSMKKEIEEIILTKKANIYTVKDNKNDYIRKTNDIKRIKYEINLKKEAMLEFKDNIKNHINSINYTVSTIKDYKENLETTFLKKYNDNLRLLNMKFREEKKKSDNQNEELINLKNEVASLKLAVRKKETSLIKLKKWISLQIYIKEGVNPTDINEVIEKRYKNKLIFETPEELDIILKHKEDKNLRLMSEYDQCIEENKMYMNELNDLKRVVGNLEQDIDTIIVEKENILTNLKIKKKDLNNSLNELNILRQKYYQTHDNRILNKRSKSVNKKLENIYLNMNNNVEGEIIKNELGVYYKFTTIRDNLFVLIDCIYNAIIYNNISGLSFNIAYINNINNINTSRSTRAIIQMKIIEIGLNYLYGSIKEKKNLNKNNLKIIEDTCRLTDLYHKRINGNKNKFEQVNKRNVLMKKIDEKNNKVYFLPRGKIEKYNIIRIQNIKNKDRLKHKKIFKKTDIWDYLHDQNFGDKLLNENI